MSSRCSGPSVRASEAISRGDAEASTGTKVPLRKDVVRTHTDGMTNLSTGRCAVLPAVRRFVAASLVAGCAALVVTGAALGKDGDGRAEIRATGSCTASATSKLKLKSRDGIIELEFEVDHNRAGAVWRVAIVHERRVAWRGSARTSGPSGSFAVQRRIADLRGPDTVTARAWGPNGITCRATATLPGA